MICRRAGSTYSNNMYIMFICPSPQIDNHIPQLSVLETLEFAQKCQVSGSPGGERGVWGESEIALGTAAGVRN